MESECPDIHDSVETKSDVQFKCSKGTQGVKS